MKKTLFFLFLSLRMLSQNDSGEITYNIYLGFDEGFSKNETLKGFYEKAQTGAKDISFSLTINKDISLFKVNDGINTEEINFAKAFTEATNKYFIDLHSNNNIKQIDNHLGKFIINYTRKTDWKLENETKTIQGYLCYKAVSELVVKNKKGEFKYPIIAWYCPAIPYSFGPKGYYGLPGLILELQERNTTYGAVKIDLNKQNIIIKKPNEGKLVTQEEFNEIASKTPNF
ncbi:GLPGLI family protein [Flavobacterium sp. U410]